MADVVKTDPSTVMPKEETETTTADTTSAETETTGTTAGEDKAKEHMIPKSRFDEVNERMKAAEQKAEQLAARIEELSEKPTETGELPDAPEGMTPLQKVRWYVRTFGKEMVEEELGMPLADAKIALSATRETSRDVKWRQWVDLCSKHKLDPNNKDLQATVAGLIQYQKLGDSDAVKKAAEFFGSKVTKPPSPSSAETDGVTGDMTVSDAIAWTAAEASKLAQQGKRPPQLSVEEITRRSKARKQRRD